MTADASATPAADGSPASRADLMECPTHGICPTCREGWGHYLADKGYVPTVESDRVRRCYQDPAPS